MIFDQLTPETKIVYDWDDIITAVEEKYGFDHRDYAKRYSTDTVNPDAPYQDFWHWLLENTFHDCKNGEIFNYINFVEIYNDRVAAGKDEAWVLEILKILADEIGDRELSILCWW